MWRTLLHQFAAFSLFQLGIQGLGLLSALMVVNILSRQDYALATVALSMQNTMHALCDMGISIAVTSIGGRVYSDRMRFGSLIASALRMRWRLAAVVIPVLMPIMVLMLRRADATWFEVAGACTLVLIALLLDMRNAVLIRVLLLHQLVGQAQLIDLKGSLIRLLTISVAAAARSLSMLTALGADVFALFIRTLLLRKRVDPHIDLTAPHEESDRREIRRLMRLQAANGLFFCVQGQLSLWLLGFLGAQGTVADYGALSRFSFLVTFLQALLSNMLVPSFARMHGRNELTRRYNEILGLSLAIAVGMIGLVWLFRVPALWLLGPQYHHLSAELPWMVGNLMVGYVITTIWSLNAARAWITTSSLFNIPCTIAMQIIMAFSLNVTTVHGALLFSIACQLPNTVLCLIDSWRGVRSNPPPPLPQSDPADGAATATPLPRTS